MNQLLSDIGYWSMFDALRDIAELQPSHARKRRVARLYYGSETRARVTFSVGEWGDIAQDALDQLPGAKT
jgi:hypothetical protein